MQISFNLSEAAIQQLKNLADPDSFVDQLITKALVNQQRITDKPSKWALLAQEIDKNPELNLSGYSEHIKKDALEVREGFIFPGDG